MTAPGYPTDETPDDADDAADIAADACPDLETLDQFVRLDCPAELSQIIRRHVANCTTCQRLLEGDSRSERLSPSLKPTIDATNDATVERLVRGLCRDFHIETTSAARTNLPIELGPTTDSQSLGRLDHFLIRRELASGGSGTVFEALDIQTDQTVAIKFIRSADKQLLRRVEREARAASNVHHNNVVSVLSVGTAPDGRLYLVMPLVRGRSLAEWIQEQGVVPIESAVRIVLQIASGLAEVHRQGLLHRDVKPANIVVDGNEKAWLTDFGLASFVDEESSLTETGVAVGTPAYMSPEQARNAAEVDARSDIYSLGATLYECLTGTRPFRGRTHDILRQIQEREPTRPGLINDQVPRPLEAICLKAMSKSAADRYSSIELLRDDLLRWQQGKRVSARLPGARQRFVKWLRRDPKLSLAMGTVLVTAIAAAAVSGFYWSRSVEQSRLAASRFDASLQTINTLADLASQSLNGDPALASIRKQIQVMADKAFEPLVDQRPSDPAALVRYLKAMDNLGTIKHTVAGPAEALAFRQRIVDDNRAAIAQWPKNNELRRQWASMNHRLAGGHVEMRTYAEASTALDEAAKVLLETDIADRLLLGSVAHSRGTLHYWMNGDSAKAAVELRRALEHFKAYSSAFPDDKLATVSIINTTGWLSQCELALGNAKEAESMMRDVWSRNAALADAPDATYLNRLNKHRASLGLLNMLVAFGEAEQALEWSRQVGPEVRELQEANPSLMEPAALRIGFGCDSVAAELLVGNVAEAVEHTRELLAAAQELDTRFPDTTRVWQVVGHAKQMWMFSCLQAGDYETLIPFLDEWIAGMEVEIAAQKNVGFNQQVLQMLRLNQALALEWSGDASRVQQTFELLAAAPPANLELAIAWLRQCAPTRRALDAGQPAPPLADPIDWEALGSSLDSLRTVLGGSMRYPSVSHTMAECHALVAFHLQENRLAPDQADPKLEQHRQKAKDYLAAAQKAGFYLHGDRESLLDNPLLKPYATGIEQ